MEALARHAARLGDAAAATLEAAVRRAATVGARAVGRFAFLNLDCPGMVAYRRQRARFSDIFKRCGWNPQGDKAVRAAFTSSPGAGPAAPPWPHGATLRPQGGANSVLPPPLGDMQLRIAELRFAHNDQAERFGGGRGRPFEDRSILQLVAELLSGKTALEVLPRIDVCRHEGLWFCRTGNRRVAAIRLAHRYAPSRFNVVRVRQVPVDETFLHGTFGRAPKLTTNLNGKFCKGRWLRIRETGEAVGPGPAAEGDYGADLLALLPGAGGG